MIHHFEGNGSASDFVLNYVPLKDAQGNIFAISIYAKNISELIKKIERERVVS